MSFQIIGEPPEVTQKRDSLQALAKGLGNFVNHTHAQNKLQKILGTPDYQKAELPEKQRMLTEYADRFGEAGNKVLQTQLEYEQRQEQLNRSKMMAKELGVPNLAGQEPDIIIKGAQKKRSQAVGRNMKQTMIDAGVPEEQANNFEQLFANSEPGSGQTHVMQQATELIARHRARSSVNETQPVGSGSFSKVNPDFEFPKPQIPEFQTNKEYNTFKRDNIKANSENFNENLRNKKLAKENEMNLNLLRQYNPKIPTGFDKWDINPMTGELLVPAAAPPEAQEYAKVITRMLNGAKEVFGARITNFDAQTYLQGLPNMAMSPEGRELITRHMQLANQMNKTYYDALDEVYKRYSKGELTEMEAQNMAEQIAKPRMDELEKEWYDVYNQMQGIQSFDSMPDPSTASPTDILTGPNGEEYIIQNGQWVPK